MTPVTSEGLERAMAKLRVGGTSAEVKRSFGDLEFDGLDAGKYSVGVEAERQSPNTLESDSNATEHVAGMVQSKS